jgi:hypothetical protein
MQFNQAQFAAIVETAKAKAADSPRWIRAIDRAAAGLQSGELIVTLLADGALVTSPRGSYFVNGHCECAAAQHGDAICYHRSAVRLAEMMEAAPAPKRQPTKPTITRSIERNRFGVQLNVTRCDNWLV